MVADHLGSDADYLGHFGPYFTSEYARPRGRGSERRRLGSDEVGRFFCDNALYWARARPLRRLRLDGVHAFLDRRDVPFLEQLRREVHELEQRVGRTKVLIAESDLNDPRLIRSVEAAGLGLDAQWSDDFHGGPLAEQQAARRAGRPWVGASS